MNTNTIVQKLWNYCNVLRDDGMSYGDYPSASLRAGSEQLTYLLFLKMADERSRPPYNQESPVPEGYGWSGLLWRDGDDLFDHYRHTLEELGRVRHILLTHGHLDHIAFIPFLVDSVFDALVGNPITIHLQAETLEILREHIFNWRIWPDAPSASSTPWRTGRRVFAWTSSWTF